MPLMSGIGNIAVCPPSPIADDLSVLPSLTSFPFSSQKLFWPVHWMSASLCYLLDCATVLFKALCCKIKYVFFIFLCLFFMYHLCEKHYKPVTMQYYIASLVSWVSRITLLDLRTHQT